MLAEQYIAGFQLLQVELANQDLCLPKAKVSVHFELGEMSEPEIKALAKTDGLHCKVIWPRPSENTDRKDESLVVLTASINLIGKVSFSPFDEFWEMIQEKLKEGLSAKILAGHTYSRLYSDFVTEEYFNKGRKVLTSAPEMK